MRVKDIPNEYTAYTTKTDVDAILEQAYEDKMGERRYTSKEYPVVFCMDNDKRVYGIDSNNCFMASGQLDWEPETEVFEIK